MNGFNTSALSYVRKKFKHIVAHGRNMYQSSLEQAH